MKARTRPRTVDEMIAWLRAHPEEPFFTAYSDRRLMVGTRDDNGEINAWDCEVTGHRWDLDRRPARQRKERRR